MKALILLTTLLTTIATSALNLPPIAKEKQYFPIKNESINGGFENDKSSWTASGGSFTIITAGMGTGARAGEFDASASAQTLTNNTITVPQGYFGNSGAAVCSFKTTATDYLLEVYDGTNVLSSITIPASTEYRKSSLNFPFPSSGTVALRVKSQSNAAAIDVDDCYIGLADNILEVSQAQLVASAYKTAAASCSWSRTNTALGDFATTAACTGTVVEQDGGVCGITTTDDDLPQLVLTNCPPGRYEVSMSFEVGSASTTAMTMAISDGTTTSGQNVPETDSSGQAYGQVVVGTFNYTSAGNRTFKLQGASSTGAVLITNTRTGTGQRFQTIVKRYPSSTEIGYKADQNPMSWSGYHDTDCQWTTTSASYVDPSNDGSCTFTELTNRNFGSVTSAGAKTPGIVFTPARIGRYLICVSGNQNNTTNAAALSLQLVNGATQIDEVMHEVIAGQAGSYQGFQLCGVADITTIASTTVKIQMKTSAGTQTLKSSSARLIWKVTALDQQMPSPMLVNSVMNSSSGVTRIETAKVNCDASSTIISQHGSWLSTIGNISGGGCALTMSAGLWSATPYCMISWANSNFSVGKELGISADSTTALTTDCEDDASTACTDFDAYITCIGAK